MVHSKQPIPHQRGMATLTISVILLLLLTFFTVFTANTSRKEQQISADQYRTEQSLNAALAGLDWALDYYNTTGLDADHDDVVDIGPGGNIKDEQPFYIGSETSSETKANAAGDLVVKSRSFFCNSEDSNFLSDPESCTTLPDPDDASTIGLVSIGYSDDDTAHRVLSIRAAPLSPYPGGDGPTTPLTSHGSVTVLGNATITNRYYDFNVWSGHKSDFHASSSESYIRDRNIQLPDPNLTDFEKCPDDQPEDQRDRFHECNRPVMNQKGQGQTIPGALPASFDKRGNNADVIDEDPLLSGLITHAELGNGEKIDCNVEGANEKYFFCAFLTLRNKKMFRDLADAGGQYFAGEPCEEIADGKPLEGDPDTKVPLTGLIYWEGEECGLKAGKLEDGQDKDIIAGTMDSPAFIFIDGDLVINGGTIYGLLYVTGILQIAGDFTVKGSSITEGGVDIREGGTGEFIYDIFAVNPDSGFDLLRGILPGTWRDWASN